MRKISIVLMFIFLGLVANTVKAQDQQNNNSPAPSKNYLEFRVARAQDGGTYAFFNYDRAINSKLVFDFVAVRSSGTTELFTGLGFPQQVTKKLTVTPLLYNVVGESGEVGICLGTVVNGSVKFLNLSGFAGHFEPIKGPMARYTFVDTFDATSSISKHYELGVSSKWFNQLGQNTGGLGPVLKRTDNHGYWAMTLRFGSGKEFQGTRVFTF